MGSWIAHADPGCQPGRDQLMLEVAYWAACASPSLSAWFGLRSSPAKTARCSWKSLAKETRFARCWSRWDFHAPLRQLRYGEQARL